LKPPVEISFVMRVLFFAQLKDATGAAELEMKISGNLDADGLWRALIAEQPKLAAFRKTTRLACNNEYADAQTRFNDADEVALIPPVSGG
jgi:molybdopterin converting factor subunit 1